MYQIRNFTNNDDVKILDSLGAFTVVEYQKDLSVTPETAALAYYCNIMNVKKRQVVCDVGASSITTQSGAMQWTVGNVNATTGVKGVGDLFGKALRGSVTNTCYRTRKPHMSTFRLHLQLTMGVLIISSSVRYLRSKHRYL